MIKHSRQILPDQMYDNDSDQSSGFCSDASSYHLTSEYLRRIEQLFLENRLSKDFFCAYRTNKKRTTSNKKTSTNKKTLDIKHKAERHWFEVETDEEAFDVKVWSSCRSKTYKKF
ncbi:uncharacterized protein LOC136039809 [Artemia franciscana]|uniref:uncharacterized protein LOC136039809 n=1 Tax=Artemia franciscana TaxID=6661 RepID=UPI0032D9DFF4